MRQIIVFLTLLIFTLPVNIACAKSPFIIDGKVIKSGERQDIKIPIAEGKTDPETFIPLTIIRGERSGPTVLMVSGVHGYEFAPILAAQRLAVEIKPETLNGTLIVVKVAHVSAFENRSPYVNPYDRKNLNRSFPGAPNGTQTERIAHALSTKVIPLADVVFDVHSGDGAEWLEAFVGVYGGPLATDYPLALSLAKAFQFPNIVRYKMKTQAQIDRGRSLNRQAVAQGLPTLLVEIGENGKRDEADVETIVTGVKNALKHMNMMEADNPVAIFKPNYFDGTQSVPVKHSGIWSPVSNVSKFVKEGDILGVIHDYEGALVETVSAPIDGYTLYGLAGPPVKSGESVVTIAKSVRTLDDK